MDNGRRTPEDAHSVATALATAVHRPLVVAWQTHPDGELHSVVSMVDGDRGRAVVDCLTGVTEAANGEPRRLDLAPELGGWVAVSRSAPESAPSDHRIFVAVPDDVGATLLDAIARSVDSALGAVLLQRWWQALTDAGPTMVVVLDDHDTITHVSDSVRQVLGYVPSDLVGADATELLRPGREDHLRARIDRHLDDPATPLADSDQPLNAQVRHSDGTWRWLETLAADHLDDPIINGVVLTCRDVTAAVEAQRTIEVEQQRLGFVLDNSADIISVFRDDGTAEYVTPSVERVLGWTVEEIMSRSAFKLLHPDDLPHVTESLDTAITEPGERRTGRFRFRHRDGSWVWLEARAMVAPGREDVAVVSARDVAEEVEARARAEAEEVRYRSLVEGSPQAIAIHQDTRFVYLNQAAAHLLGAERPADLVGWPVARFSTTSSQITSERAEALQQGQVLGPFETTVTGLDGRTLTLEVTSIPTTWNGGHAIQVVAVDITERRRTESLLAHTTLHDPVSGLPNRRLLADRIDQALRRARRSGERSALIFCDLDRFKVINDALGHSVGDQVLVDAAHRIRSLTRETDTVARFAGDEFVVLSQALNTDDDVLRLVDRIQSTFEAPFEVMGNILHVSVSIGVARITGSESRDEVISFAETAMFAAKEAGRNRWVMADEHLRKQADDRLQIQNQLRASLDTGEGLEVHLQPEFDLASRQVVGYEALIRWRTADGTSVPPDRFLPIAADAGLMHRICHFVANETANAIAQLPPRRPPDLDRDERLGRGDRAPRLRPGGPRRARTCRRGSSSPVPGDHRAQHHAGSTWHRHGAAATPRERGGHRHRRLRHRLLVTRLPGTLLARVSEDRPIVHRRPGRPAHSPPDRRGRAAPRRLPRHRRDRGGHRDRGSGAPAPRARLPDRTGLALRPTSAGRAGHRRTGRLSRTRDQTAVWGRLDPWNTVTSW